MTAKEIILNIEAYYGMSSNALAAELGVNHTRIDNLVSGKTKTITKSTSDLLLQHFPSLNPDFVLKGHEPMTICKKAKDMIPLTTSEMMSLIMQQYQILSTAEIARKIGWNSNVVSSIRIGVLYKQFSSKRVKDLCNVFPELNPNWLFLGTGDMFLNGRTIDSSLPMPAPVRINNGKNKKKAKSKTHTKPAKKQQPVQVETVTPTQAQINRAILEELRALRAEINDLRNGQGYNGFAAETPNKD